ncbi:MAG: phosphopantetheine-binding protein [Flavobacteriaceae bacterium]|nr:phosphopantetheine-binding protein [Flavobacteriaceae bacterium]
MSDDNIFIERFCEILFESDEIVIDLSSEFRDLDEWDSLIGMAIQIMLKDKYNVDLKTEIFESLNTVGDIYSFILQNNLNKK